MIRLCFAFFGQQFKSERGQTDHQSSHEDIFCWGGDTNAVLGLVEEFHGGLSGRVNRIGSVFKGDNHDQNTDGRHGKSCPPKAPAFVRRF